VEVKTGVKKNSSIKKLQVNTNKKKTESLSGVWRKGVGVWGEKKGRRTTAPSLETLYEKGKAKTIKPYNWGQRREGSPKH